MDRTGVLRGNVVSTGAVCTVAHDREDQRPRTSRNVDGNHASRSSPQLLLESLSSENKLTSNSVNCDEAGAFLCTSFGKARGVSGIRVTGILVLVYKLTAMTVLQSLRSYRSWFFSYLSLASMQDIAVPDVTPLRLRTHTPRSDARLEICRQQHLRMVWDRT